MIDDLSAYISGMEQQLKEERLKNVSNTNSLAMTMFSGEKHDNIIKWQLDIKEELERIEHLLRGHIARVDSKGNEIWEEPANEDKLFNEKGVKEILKIISFYLTKNIILSNFNEEEIRIMSRQFGHELNDFIYINYEELGLDTDEKLRHIPMIVLCLFDSVSASMKRALDGLERQGLQTQRLVTQNETINNGIQGGNMQMPQKTQVWYKPSTWIK